MGQRVKTIPKIIFLKLPAVFIKNFLQKFSVKLTQLNLFLKNLLQRFSVKRTKRHPESCFSYLSRVFLWNRVQKFYDVLKLRFNQTYNYLKIIFWKEKLFVGFWGMKGSNWMQHCLLSFMKIDTDFPDFFARS